MSARCTHSTLNKRLCIPIALTAAISLTACGGGSTQASAGGGGGSSTAAFCTALNKLYYQGGTNSSGKPTSIQAILSDVQATDASQGTPIPLDFTYSADEMQGAADKVATLAAEAPAVVAVPELSTTTLKETLANKIAPTLTAAANGDFTDPSSAEGDSNLLTWKSANCK